MKSSELLRLMKKDGWYEIRQSGSHVIMKHPVKKNIIPVPSHPSKEMKKGTLNIILKLAEIETNKR
jgi:predicted RNA binding protein YcfA (HicA-like mRNA interferase family)